MSPRRMDISSLLRDPSPPSHDRPPLPASLLNILNSPLSQNDRPLPTHRPPFLGLDALVHVASEERRRISAASPDPPTHDHDRPRYTYPFHRHPSLVQDNSRPHKRPRDACPPSPPRSPSLPPSYPPIAGQSTSPNTRHHPSASPTNSYPTLRPQPALHIDPTRSSPVGLISDTRTLAHSPSLPLQHTSPFLLTSQPLTHSSPRNNSPHRHSPQHIRSQHHSSPIHSGSHIPASVDVEAMSPRYGYGPRMAGGIGVLSNDPSPVRDPPRPDFSFYQSPGRDLSAERLLSESHTEYARHELPKLSPLSARPFFLDSDRRQAETLSHNVEAPEREFPRERQRSRPPHLAFVDATTDSVKNIAMPAREPDLSARPSLERHPVRVWEEQPTAREVCRRISPVRMSSIVSSSVEAHTWSAAGERGHGEQPANEDRAMSRQNVVENVPLSTCKKPSPPRQPAPEPLVGLQTPVKGTRLHSQPSSPTPKRSEPQTHLTQTFLNSPTPPASASPVLDLHIKNLETQSELQPARSETQVDMSASAPPTLSDPIVTEPAIDVAEQMHVGDTNTSLIPDPLPRHPSPESVRPMPALEPGLNADISRCTRGSPSQQPLTGLQSAKDEHNPLAEDIQISPPTQPEPAPRQSPLLTHTIEREPLILEQAMMDVDEELLSLVEDRPARAVSAVPKMQVDSKPFLPITVGQAAGTGAGQSREASDGPSLVPPSQSTLKVPLMTDEEKDRASMPPPAARNRKAENDKTTLATSTATGSKKKKDGTPKPAAKPKQPSKPRAKSAPKPKVKPNVADSSSKAGISKGVVNVNSRSRSTSVIPGSVEDVVPEQEADDCDKEDDKLYCVCKTRYDEDRMMIACDRCDEWFHTICVDMPDLEIDLVDQFICPPCVQKHPHLRTTWKRRCLFGLQHENPSSLEACHKPSRGVFSKYCSDDCGIKFMQARIAQWEKSGGERNLLWESVKNAPKREGVVVRTATNGTSPRKMDVDNLELKPLDHAAKQRAEREVTRLNARLEEVVKERELMKRELDMVIWREKVVELASERAGKVDECGWDQRLCFGEEEWADFGAEVLDSYEEERVKVDSGDDAMPLDAASATHGEWWCTGKKKCERHAGWQKLRAAEVSFDKESKEGILLKLTTREREIRKCIEDILYPQPTGTLQAPPLGVQLNGTEKPCSKGNISERGRKRTS